MPQPHHSLDVWSVEGYFSHRLYSPKGSIEGILIDTDGVPTQFVLDRHDHASATVFTGLQAGQRLVLEGTEQQDAPPSGEAEHTVYELARIASIDGQPPAPPEEEANVRGTVVRIHHARHGQANGVLLDSGDFVHAKPHGMARLGLRVGDTIDASGPARPLADGRGRVIEAWRINGQRLDDE